MLGGGWVWADAAGKNAASLAIAAGVGGCPPVLAPKLF